MPLLIFKPNKMQDKAYKSKIFVNIDYEKRKYLVKK